MKQLLRPDAIRIGLAGADMQELIRRMVATMVRGHPSIEPFREALECSAWEREQQVSTCLGEGIAVPHGFVPVGVDPAVAVGIAAAGVSVPTPDLQPLRLVFLIAAPEDQRDVHLQTLAWIAAAFGGQPAQREALCEVQSKEEALRILSRSTDPA